MEFNGMEVVFEPNLGIDVENFVKKVDVLYKGFGYDLTPELDENDSNKQCTDWVTVVVAKLTDDDETGLSRRSTEYTPLQIEIKATSAGRTVTAVIEINYNPIDQSPIISDPPEFKNFNGAAIYHNPSSTNPIYGSLTPTELAQMQDEYYRLTNQYGSLAGWVNSINDEYEEFLGVSATDPAWNMPGGKYVRVTGGDYTLTSSNDMEYLYVANNLTISGNVRLPNLKKVYVGGRIFIGGNTNNGAVTTISGRSYAETEKRVQDKLISAKILEVNGRLNPELEVFTAEALLMFDFELANENARQPVLAREGNRLRVIGEDGYIKLFNGDGLFGYNSETPEIVIDYYGSDFLVRGNKLPTAYNGAYAIQVNATEMTANDCRFFVQGGNILFPGTNGGTRQYKTNSVFVATKGMNSLGLSDRSFGKIHIGLSHNTGHSMQASGQLGQFLAEGNLKILGFANNKATPQGVFVTLSHDPIFWSNNIANPSFEIIGLIVGNCDGYSNITNELHSGHVDRTGTLVSNIHISVRAFDFAGSSNEAVMDYGLFGERKDIGYIPPQGGANYVPITASLSGVLQTLEFNRIVSIRETTGE